MTVRGRIRSTWRRNPRLGGGLWLLLLAIGASGCTPQRNDENVSRKASMRVAQEFLRASAAGDSAGLTPLARDTVVKTVLLNHRFGTTEHFRAADTTFQSPKVDIYPSASDVRFRYRIGKEEYDAVIFLELEDGRLVVANYGIPAIID
jgi:hypothetical protein